MAFSVLNRSIRLRAVLTVLTLAAVAAPVSHAHDDEASPAAAEPLGLEVAGFRLIEPSILRSRPRFELFRGLHLNLEGADCERAPDGPPLEESDARAFALAVRAAWETEIDLSERPVPVQRDDDVIEIDGILLVRINEITERRNRTLAESLPVRVTQEDGETRVEVMSGGETTMALTGGEHPDGGYQGSIDFQNGVRFHGRLNFENGIYLFHANEFELTSSRLDAGVEVISSLIGAFQFRQDARGSQVAITPEGSFGLRIPLRGGRAIRLNLAGGTGVITNSQGNVDRATSVSGRVELEL